MGILRKCAADFGCAVAAGFALAVCPGAPSEARADEVGLLRTTPSLIELEAEPGARAEIRVENGGDTGVFFSASVYARRPDGVLSPEPAPPFEIVPPQGRAEAGAPVTLQLEWIDQALD